MRAEERRAIVTEGERDARQTPNRETRMTLREHTTTAAGTEAHGPILTTRLAAEAQTVLRPMPSRRRPSRVKETNSTEGSAMAAIEIQGLSKRFGDITAVDDLS